MQSDHSVSASPSPAGHSAMWPHTVELTFADMDDKPRGVRKDILKVIKNGGKLNPRARRAVVRHVVARVYEVHPKPYRCHMEIIAQKMVQIIPDLKDSLGDVVIGRGYDSFLNQLVAKAEDMRRGTVTYRPSKRRLQDSDDEEENEQPKPKKAYGYTAHLPEEPQEESGPLYDHYHQRLMVAQGASVVEIKDK